MKKFITFCFVLFSIVVSAQLTFQSTIHNSSGQIVPNKVLSLRFSIKVGSITGTTVYSEIQYPVSDSQGAISLVIGTGTPTFGTYSGIDWTAGIHFVTVELYTGSGACQWVEIPIGANGQVASKCNGAVVWGLCSTEFTNLVWADEFTSSGAVLPQNWFSETVPPNNGNWSNGEVQHYTDRIDNATVSNGTLKITAKKENYTFAGVTKQYTSARLNSMYSFTYGRVDVRAKLPVGAGTWPAIWMLGTSMGNSYTTTTLNWPYCGEIDIMEHWGNNPNYIHGSIHNGSSYGSTVNTSVTLATNVSSSFHVYSIKWTATEIVFLIDNVSFYTYHPSVKNANTWPFDSPQFILLNIAMGGTGGTIDSSFVSSEMEIDYVRVYQ